MIAENMWRAVGWTCDSKPNAVLTTLKYICAWRSTAWWQNTKARNITVDSNNHTRWKHMWEVHNRGCVGDKIAPEWAGEEEWSNKRRSCQNSVDKIDFVTLAMMSAKHSAVHRPIIGESIKPNKDRKAPRKLEPPVSSVTIRSDGTTVQVCGDSNVAEKWINGHSTMGQKHHGEIGRTQKTLHSWWMEHWRIQWHTSTIT